MSGPKSTDSTLFVFQISLFLLCILIIFKPPTGTKTFELLSTKLTVSEGKNLSHFYRNQHHQVKVLSRKVTATVETRPSTRARSNSCLTKGNLSLKQFVFFIILLAGDIQSNPGPPISNKSIFPCGHCELPVIWSTAGICCDQCDVLHHKSYLGIPSTEYNNLANLFHWMEML